MKVLIDHDEYYPFYEIHIKWEDFEEHYGKVVDLSDDKLQWINSAMEEFKKVQNYLGRLNDE